MDSISITSAYMWASVTMIVLFLIAVVIANAIMYKPNSPGTTERRIWFWVLCAATLIVSFLINYFIAGNIEVPSVKSAYLTHSAIASGVATLLYIVIGFTVSKIFSTSKVSTWF